MSEKIYFKKEHGNMTVLNEFTFLNGVTAPCYSKELLNNAGEA